MQPGEVRARTSDAIDAHSHQDVHHALGLTDGVRALAEQIAAGGHTVHTPDLYDGRTFATVDEGVAHAQQIGFEEIGRRGMRACAEHQ